MGLTDPSATGAAPEPSAAGPATEPSSVGAATEPSGVGLGAEPDPVAEPGSPPVTGTSAAPADVVRRQYLASAAGDLDALRATLAPDVEWTEMAGFPLAGTYRTPDGVTTHVMAALGADWDDWTAHDDAYVAEGENVVVLARYTARNRATGKELAARVAHHFVVRGGLIVRFEQFVDTALVRDAMTP